MGAIVVRTIPPCSRWSTAPSTLYCHMETHWMCWEYLQHMCGNRSPLCPNYYITRSTSAVSSGLLPLSVSLFPANITVSSVIDHLTNIGEIIPSKTGSASDVCACVFACVCVCFWLLKPLHVALRNKHNENTAAVFWQNRPLPWRLEHPSAWGVRSPLCIPTSCRFLYLLCGHTYSQRLRQKQLPPPPSADVT